MKTNKDIVCTRIGRVIDVTVEIPKGSKVEKNEKSPTGYYLSPDNFDRNSLYYHDAYYYGFALNKKDIE